MDPKRHVGIETTPGGAVVQVGKTVEILHQEAYDLGHLAGEMHTQMRLMERGWFLKYMQAHKLAHGIIQGIIERSHAT